MRRLLVLLVLLCAMAAPPAALAQSSPFGPLPQAVTPTPSPSPTPGNVNGQSSVSRGLLLGIAGAVAILFLGIGFYISRDARRNLTEEDRRALDRAERPLTPEERKQSAQAKKTGWAIDKGELGAGTVTIAVPVLNPDGGLRMVCAAAMLIEQFEERRAKPLAQDLIKVAGRLSTLAVDP